MRGANRPEDSEEDEFSELGIIHDIFPPKVSWQLQSYSIQNFRNYINEMRGSDSEDINYFEG